jgi:branched-chain amino acid transport system ATP-binding protein
VALLELQQVGKRFRDMVVIPNLTMAVANGEFVGVIGPNGAGKTTLFGLISGNLTCNDGSVLLDGRNITHLRADQRCRAGIGRTFQIPQPFQKMTVYENVLTASTFGAALRGREAAVQASESLAQCGLEDFGDHLAGRLTLLQRKRLELARAIATRPRLLLLDEVAGGLTERELEELLGLVRRLHATGMTVIWIEHLVHALVAAATRMVVLAEGRILVDGRPADVLRDQEVRNVYLGSELDEVPHVAH